MNNADILVDLQFGSTGKGLLAGMLALSGKYDIVVNANMPNAGHTFIDGEDGIVHINKVLPSGHVAPNVKVCLGPHSVFSYEQLFKEIRFAESHNIKIRDRLLIHPCATLLSPEHKEAEENSLSGISSTMQGSATATIDKMMRSAGSMPIAGMDERLEPYIVDQGTWGRMMNDAKGILVEGSQGYSLGINTVHYPYTTSRSCTPAAFMDYCGVPIRCMRDIIGVMRTFPIRVGNTDDGYSGHGYPDQEELEWTQFGVVPETTTVTGRIRRIFSFSNMQLEDALNECQPNKIFLNFCNYCEDEDELKSMVEDIILQGQQAGLSSQIIQWMGFGPTTKDIQESNVAKLQ
jgi:adenylosuccinate synthase